MDKTMLTLRIERNSVGMRSAAEPAHSKRCSGEIGETLAAATVQANEKRYCTRCLEARQARYRVRTDLLDMAVCSVCAEQALDLGIRIEQLDQI